MLGVRAVSGFMLIELAGSSSRSRGPRPSGVIGGGTEGSMTGGSNAAAAMACMSSPVGIAVTGSESLTPHEWSVSVGIAAAVGMASSSGGLLPGPCGGALP